MKKDLKSLAGLLLGAVLGYFIIRLIFEGDESVINTTIGVALGMVITYAAIIGFKKAAGKYDDQED
ncbi:hypothetical protein [Planococcus sp. CAU13]|uniref:hypothetical protein n=1 Tax=Planococcus sp. CAU13 TaxID=1541197 RepID=UPI00052FFB2B|nr:hypothetical protein [Planococcus sp. CAU13]